VAAEARGVSATLRFIGRIRTPYPTPNECPRTIDPNGPRCELVLEEAFTRGLSGLAEGDHIIVLYWLDEANRNAEMVQRRRGTGPRTGVFALRSPHRPNPIGLAEVRIEGIGDSTLQVRGMDCRDGTPLIDIKPARSGGTS
jgi:tRNA-Thr(GGU) m(6)t(6)A37 methyltransferase TsaA